MSETLPSSQTGTHAPHRRTLLRAGVAGAALTLLGACSARMKVAAPVPEVNAPRIAVGDRWHYDEYNGFNGLRVAGIDAQVTEVSPDGALALRLSVEGEPVSNLRDGQIEHYPRPWSVAQDAAFDLCNRYEPALPLLPWPLRPGDAQRHASQVSVPGDAQRYRWIVVTRVGDWERVSVPAGEFDALRVHRRIHFVHPDFARDYATRSDTLWYAPRVGRWVQREWRGEYQRRFERRDPVVYQEDRVIWKLCAYTRGPVAEAA